MHHTLLLDGLQAAGPLLLQAVEALLGRACPFAGRARSRGHIVWKQQLCRVHKANLPLHKGHHRFHQHKRALAVQLIQLKGESKAGFMEGFAESINVGVPFKFHLLRDFLLAHFQKPGDGFAVGALGTGSGSLGFPQHLTIILSKAFERLQHRRLQRRGQLLVQPAQRIQSARELEYGACRRVVVLHRVREQVLLHKHLCQTLEAAGAGGLRGVVLVNGPHRPTHRRLQLSCCLGCCSKTMLSLRGQLHRLMHLNTRHWPSGQLAGRRKNSSRLRAGSRHFFQTAANRAARFASSARYVPWIWSSAANESTNATSAFRASEKAVSACATSFAVACHPASTS
eukprot:m.235423 g.235423  ORF g.235423 m.235423 type:complete len:341 (-) comp22481_c1_seq1:895-1917(-)